MTESACRHLIRLSGVTCVRVGRTLAQPVMRRILSAMVVRMCAHCVALYFRVVPPYKTCPVCKHPLPATEEFFYPQPGGQYGLSSRCRSCHSRKSYESRIKRETQMQPSVRAEYYRRTELLRKYGLTPEEFDARWEAQGRCCAICGTAELGQRNTGDGPRRPSVDHDHSCCPGQRTCGNCLRDLLCMNCNLGIGNFQEDPAVLRAAAEYLERWRLSEHGGQARPRVLA